MAGPELRSEAEYEAALREIERLTEEDPGKGTAEHDELQRLHAMVEAYDASQLHAHSPDDYPVGDEDED